MFRQSLKSFTDKYLLAPPKCAFCGDERCTAAVPICDVCYKHYLRHMLEGCADCGAMPLDCTCVTVKGCAQLYRLFNYQGDVMRRLIYRLKQIGNKESFGFFAARLVDMVLVKTAGMVPFDCVCFVPRAPFGKRRYGYDQGQELAKPIAKLLGLPCCEFILHTGVKVEQKRLARAFRGNAAKTRFKINQKALTNGKLPYKSVLLVDDIVTTGATMGQCAKLLKDHGAKYVCGAFIAHTPSYGRMVF